MAENDPVQPEGQGGSVQDAPYAEYLNRIPEEARGDVEPIFKEWDSNVTRRFQEAAEYRKQWENLEDTGVRSRDPDEVRWAMQFVDALDDPNAIRQWYENYQQENGQAQPEAEQEWVDPSLQQSFEKMLRDQMGPVASQLAELSEWRQAQEQAAAERQARQSIEDQLSELQTSHPDEFNRDWIERLVPNYIESDPQNAVSLAFKDWQQLRNELQRDTLQQKVDQPTGAESGGVADATPEAISTLQKAAEIAREQIRASRGT